MDLKEPLRTSGWYLSPEGLSQCAEQCQQRGWEPTQRNVEKIAADCDLRAIGEKALSEDIVRNLQHQVEGPIVLQIQRVKNVAVPSSSKPLPSPGRRLLRFHITDGHVHCSAVEMGGPIQNLSPLTPPGTKVRLQGKVEVKNGFLLLGRSSLEHLGGQVEHLLKKWSLQETVPDNVERRKAGTEGPPPFIAFKDIAPAGKQPPQKQLQPSGREAPRSGERKTQNPRFEDRRERSDANSDERRHHRDSGRDRPPRAASGRHDGKSAGYKSRQPSQQHRNQDSRERDSPSRSRQQQQRPDRLGTSHRTERETGTSNDGQIHSAGTRDSHRQPRQRDDSRSHQRGSREESGRKTEYQLSDWLDQKLKVSTGSDSQRVFDDQEDGIVGDSLDTESRDRVPATEREGSRSDYGRRDLRRGRREEPGWREGDSLDTDARDRVPATEREGSRSDYSRRDLRRGRREEPGWREGDSGDGDLGAGERRSLYDQPRNRHSRPPGLHQRGDLPADKNPKPGDFRSGASRQYGSGNEDFREAVKPEALERHVKTRGAGRGKSVSENLGRRAHEQSRPHSKERVIEESSRLEAGHARQERGDFSSQRHGRGRGGLASHPRARDAGRGGSHGGGNAPQGELESEKYSWEWVNKGAPCGATKQ